LRLDEVDPGDLFSHRVFDLKPHVGLDEGDGRIVALIGGIDQEFERSGVEIFGCRGEVGRGAQQAVAHHRTQVRRRRDLDDLLAFALQAALALPQMRHRAAAVADDLHLDVSRARKQFFDINIGVAERLLGFRRAAFHDRGKLRRIGHRTHAAPAAAGDRLHHHGSARAE